MFSLTGSIFKNMVVTGDLTDGFGCQFEGCDISGGALTNIGESRFDSCILGGTNTIKDGENPIFNKCFSNEYGDVTFDYNSPTAITLIDLPDFKGEVVLTNMNDKGYVNISGDCLLIIAATCINAKVKLAGNVKLDDQGTSTAITDNRVVSDDDIQIILDSITDSETNVLDAISDVPTNILDEVIDGTATVRAAIKRTLAYCNSKIIRLGALYTYRDFDDTANLFEFEVVVTPGGHTRIRTDL